MNNKLHSLWQCVLIIAATFLILMQKGGAQDIHFSQFYYAPLNMNPALTGIFGGDMRFVGNYRNQWASVPVDYLTFSGSFDKKFYKMGWDNVFFGGGLLFNYDRAGDSKLSMLQLGLNGSITLSLDKNHFITAGVQTTSAQRSFKTEDLQFETQYNGELFDSSLPTQENSFNTNKMFFDFGTGINYHYQHPNKRTYANAGGALFHINEPDISFDQTGTDDLYRRFSLFGEGIAKLTSILDLGVRVSSQFQGGHRETILGPVMRMHLSDKRARELALDLGLSYRFVDAIIPNIGLKYSSWTFGVSYDVNISDFDVATNRNGGLEFALVYIITNPEMGVFRVCNPLF